MLAHPCTVSGKASSVYSEDKQKVFCVYRHSRVCAWKHANKSPHVIVGVKMHQWRQIIVIFVVSVCVCVSFHFVWGGVIFLLFLFPLCSKKLLLIFLTRGVCVCWGHVRDLCWVQYSAARECVCVWASVLASTNAAKSIKINFPLRLSLTHGNLRL